MECLLSGGGVGLSGNVGCCVGVRCRGGAPLGGLGYVLRKYSIPSLSILSFSLSLSTFSVYSFSNAPECLMNVVSLRMP